VLPDVGEQFVQGRHVLPDDKRKASGILRPAES
jgi:hypothetical protein